jgi:hypothetical protein
MKCNRVALGGSLFSCFSPSFTAWNKDAVVLPGAMSIMSQGCAEGRYLLKVKTIQIHFQCKDSELLLLSLLWENIAKDALQQNKGENSMMWDPRILSNLELRIRNLHRRLGLIKGESQHSIGNTMRKKTDTMPSVRLVSEWEA